MKDKKTRMLGVRLDEDTFARLDNIERLTGVEKVTLARLSLMAMLDYFDHKGRISFPLKVIEGSSPSPRIILSFVSRLAPENCWDFGRLAAKSRAKSQGENRSHSEKTRSQMTTANPQRIRAKTIRARTSFTIPREACGARPSRPIL